MEKRALLGEILFGILLIFLIAGIIIGITLFQAYSLYKTFKNELPLIQQETGELQILLIAQDINKTQEICVKFKSIESRVNYLESETISTCKNPLIKIIVDKMEQIPVKCDNVSAFKEELIKQSQLLREICK